MDRCRIQLYALSVASPFPGRPLPSPWLSEEKHNQGTIRPVYVLTTVALSNNIYPAYPSCLPTAVNLSTGSMAFFLLNSDACLKCSTNLPTRISLRASPNCFFIVSHGAIEDAGWFVR